MATELSAHVDNSTLEVASGILRAKALGITASHLLGTFPLLTADPGSPANDTWWLKRTGSGPYEISLNVRIAGTTHSIPLYTTA